MLFRTTYGFRSCISFSFLVSRQFCFPLHSLLIQFGRFETQLDLLVEILIKKIYAFYQKYWNELQYAES